MKFTVRQDQPNNQTHYMRLLISLLFLFSFLTAFSQQKPDENLLFNAFKQGSVKGGGNCASIALIKAAIGTFGIDSVFSYSAAPNGNSITVKLKNDSTIEVKYSEILEATKANGFKIKSTDPKAALIKAYADTCFAIMVKMNEIIWEYPSFKEALEGLLNGYNTPAVHDLLGLEFENISTDLAALRANKNIIFYNSYHAVFSSYGYYDETKSKSGYSLNENFKKNRFGYKCSWYLCDPRNAFILKR